jgi:MFS family permease
MNQLQPNPAKAWTVTFTGTGINLALGVLYTWSVFAQALVANMGWTKTQSAFPYTLACIMFAVCMIPAGRMVDKIGPRAVSTLGGVLAGGGLIVAGMYDSVLMTTIGFGLILGSGMGFGYAAPTPAAVKWFHPHKKGQIAGIVVAGFGLASVYIAPLTNYFVNTFGTQRAFFLEGFLFLAIIVVLSQFLSVPPQGYVPHGDPPSKTSGGGASSGRDYSAKEMLSTPQFYMLWFMFCFASSAGLLIIGHLATITQIQGGIQWGFILVAVLAIGNAGGRVIAGFLSDSIGRTNTMRLVFLLQAANMFLFITYSSPALLLVGSIVTGAAYGSLLALFPSATFDYYGLKNAGFNYGILFSAWGASALIGPIIGGIAADMTGGYGTSYTISGVLLLVAAALTFLIKAPKAIPVSKQPASCEA